jgi:hypothetical protein
MRRRKFIALVAAVFGLILIARPCSAASADQPPQEGCVAVPKIQYDSAKNKNLLRNRFGMYVRTGRFLRRRYWYCH